MTRKRYYAIVRTISNPKNKVAEFGIAICDRTGDVEDSFGAWVNPHAGNGPNEAPAEPLDIPLEEHLTWKRLLVEEFTAAEITEYLKKIVKDYAPTLVAFDLSTEAQRCARTGIRLDMFKDRICLKSLAVKHIAGSAAFKRLLRVHPELFSSLNTELSGRDAELKLFGWLLLGRPIRLSGTAFYDARWQLASLLDVVICRRRPAITNGAEIASALRRGTPTPV